MRRCSSCLRTISYAIPPRSHALSRARPRWRARVGSRRSASRPAAQKPASDILSWAKRSRSPVRSAPAASSRSHRSPMRRATPSDARHVWNAGMFCFTAESVLAAFDRHAPRVLAASRVVWQALREQRAATMLEIDPKLFASVPDVSFDVAVMEQATQVAVVRGDFDWSDVGSWRAMSNLAAPDATGNRGEGERVSIATSDTYVHADRPHRRDCRRRRAIHRRHARRRAGRAPRPSATREGSRQRVEGPRTRRVPGPHDGDAALGRIHHAPGRTRLQDQTHRGQARRGAVTADARAPQRALGRCQRRRPASPMAIASTPCASTSRLSFRSDRVTASKILAPDRCW